MNSPPVSEVVRELRSRLDCSQRELADALGISVKAIQSYEQGWRKTPERVLKQLLTLVVVKLRQTNADVTPCWEKTDCPAAVRDACLSPRLTGGQFCWMMNSAECRNSRDGQDGGIAVCMACPVVRDLLGSAR